MKWLGRCRIGGSFGASEIPLLSVSFYLSSKVERPAKGSFLEQTRTALGWLGDPTWRHCQVGSLSGAEHLSKDNAGVLRLTQRGRKPRVEQKGKSQLDLDFQCEYRLRKRGLSILLILKALSKRCQKSYHRDNWLVAAKRS